MSMLKFSIVKKFIEVTDKFKWKKISNAEDVNKKPF